MIGKAELSLQDHPNQSFANVLSKGQRWLYRPMAISERCLPWNQYMLCKAIAHSISSHLILKSDFLPHRIFHVYSNCGCCIRHAKSMFHMYWGMQSIVAIYSISHYTRCKK